MYIVSLIFNLLDFAAAMNKPEKQLCYTIRLLYILLACLLCTSANADRYNLPDISDPSYSVLSLAEEKKLARIILAEVRSQLPIIEDIEIQSYLRHLGERILPHSENRLLDFHFLPIHNPAINAFAAPGGILAFNDGLILSAESESELGGVVAHEIAHVKYRHMARLQTVSEGSGLIGTLSLIGAIIAAAYNSELAELTLFGSAALPIEKRLAYTRDFEYEADRFGMQLMAEAGIDPSGMPAFFAKLQKKEGRRQQIEFLRTHPLTISRLSEAQTRAAQYRGRFEKDSKAFRYTKARLHALQRKSTAPKYEDEDIASYYTALNLIKKQLPAQALEQLTKIPPEQQNLSVKLAFVHAYRAMGNWRKAIALLNELNDLHPGRAAVLYYLALCLIKDEQAQKALAQINATATLHSYHPQFYKLGAQAAIQLGRHSEYHEYLADYYASEGRIEPALHQLDLAEKSDALHQSVRARITAKRKDLKELRQEM